MMKTDLINKIDSNIFWDGTRVEIIESILEIIEEETEVFLFDEE